MRGEREECGERREGEEMGVEGGERGKDGGRRGMDKGGEGWMEGEGRRVKGGGGAREGGLREGLRGREIHQPTRKTRPSLADIDRKSVV